VKVVESTRAFALRKATNVCCTPFIRQADLYVKATEPKQIRWKTLLFALPLQSHLSGNLMLFRDSTIEIFASLG